MLVTGILTNIMSNTATTAIMVPLVIPIALGMNLSPLPFVMGIAMSAAACYMTPIATPSNTLVLRPGNYYLRGLRPVRLFLAGSLLCSCCADYPFRLAFHALTAFMGVFVQMRALICSYFGQRIDAKMVLASNITTYQTIIRTNKRWHHLCFI